MQFHTLKVAAITHPIKDATSITFAIPDALYEQFNYYPGQHLIIKFMVNGEEARRSYSLNSCPHTNEDLQVTVKRVKGGLVSNYVNDQLKVGEELAVMIPQGRFFANIAVDAYKTYYLFAAGSGITPIMAILKSVLFASPNSRVHLFYGNANQDTIIFKDGLADLAQQFPQRLNVVHTLSAPKVWTSWEQWKGKKGRIDAEAVEWFISNYPPIAQTTEYYICGPGAMNTSIRKTLIGLDIPKELIHIEQFGGEVTALNTAIEAIDNAQVLVNVKGQEHAITIPKGQTILQVLKAQNITVPYSCESGVCATCVAKITQGTAEMKSCMALEDSDLANGLILTCQALPTSEKVHLTF